MLLQLSSSLTKNDILVQQQAIDFSLWTVPTHSKQFVKYLGCCVRKEYSLSVKMAGKMRRVNDYPISKHSAREVG